MSVEHPPLQPLASVVRPPTIAFHDQSEPTPSDLRGLTCPNCGSTDPKAMVLTIDVQLPDNPAKRLRVLRCPGCTANFYDSQVPPDYAEPALNDRGRVPFYVEQGAGVSLITRPLAQLRRGAGTAYMEVGCGYGFGLDFAINTKGWTGLGIDPAPLAQVGRDALGLPIELRYLRDDDEARGTFDVVMGSEVIEHVTSPSAFVRTLRAMLKPGGVLVLTTPNGADIDPKTPPGIIIPLLSPSLHLVIQNKQSLRALLERGGFRFLTVDVDSHSLVAFASDDPLDLEEDRVVLRGALRSHLDHRARSLDPSTDLFLAFAGRALCESVNDGDMQGADRAWALLVPACRTRFGIALDDMVTLPDAIQTCSLERMAEIVPLNLGGILYARAIRRITGGESRAGIEQQFVLAAQAAKAMRRALGELAMEDGQTEDIEWTAEAEAVLCAATGDGAGLTARLQALPPAPNGGESRRHAVVLRAITNLTNAGKYEDARNVVRAFGTTYFPNGSESTPMEDVERDATFSLAVLDIQAMDGTDAGSLNLVRTRLRHVRASSERGSALWWAALRGEADALAQSGLAEDASRFAEMACGDPPDPTVAQWAIPVLVNSGHLGRARTLAGRSSLNTDELLRLASPLSDTQRDALFALAVLDSQPDAAEFGKRALSAFTRVRLEAASDTGLWWASLKGEAQALQALGRTDELAALIAAQWHNGPVVEAARWAVISLVNAGKYAEARVAAGQSGLDVAPFAQPAVAYPLNPSERDIVFALAMLDIQPGTARAEPATARGRFGRVRKSCVAGSGLWISALRGELQALDMLDALDEAATLTAEIEATQTGLVLPPDILARIGKS